MQIFIYNEKKWERKKRIIWKKEESFLDIIEKMEKGEDKKAITLSKKETQRLKKITEYVFGNIDYKKEYTIFLNRVNSLIGCIFLNRIIYKIRILPIKDLNSPVGIYGLEENTKPEDCTIAFFIG